MKSKFIYLLSLAILAVACDSARVDQPVQYGEISIALAGDPEVGVVTKAATVVDPNSADAAKYTVRIFDSDDVMKHEARFSEFKSKMLELGTYYVTAENCSEAEAEAGNGMMRVFGRSADVALTAEQMKQSVSVECTVTNARVAVKFDESVQGKFNDGNGNSTLKVVLAGGTTAGRSVEIAGADTETWFNPSTVNYAISGTFNSGNINLPVSLTGSVTLAAKDNVEILVKVDSQNGQLQPSVDFDNDLTQSDKPSGFNPY